MIAGLAVSNIAWPSADFDAAVALAGELGLQGIEIAPYNLSGTWDVSDGELRAIRTRLQDAGLVCPALQGILFNAGDVALFESDRSRKALMRHLAVVARMAGLLGATACVFGAPRQRDPGDLAADEAWEVAARFFRAVGPIFTDHGTTLAFEANARSYGCRFVTTTAEALRLVQHVDTPGFRLQIDTGTIFLESEPPCVLRDAAAFASHAHVSEPGLQAVGAHDADHRAIGTVLRESGYSGFLSIEMRLVDNWQGALRTATATVRRDYL